MSNDLAFKIIVGKIEFRMTIYGINQTMFPRYLAVPTIKVAQKAIWLSGVSITVILSIVAYAGLNLTTKPHFDLNVSLKLDHFYIFVKTI